MALTADSSARPLGTAILVNEIARFRGISWANRDSAGLLVPIRVRVPHEFSEYMTDWWIEPDGSFKEFLALLVGVGEEHAVVNWLVPTSVLDAAGLVASWNIKPGVRLMKRGSVSMSDAYSDDVPLEWVVGTACLAIPRSITIPLGECTLGCERSWLIAGGSNRCSQVSAECSGAFYCSSESDLVRLRSKPPRLLPSPADFVLADRELTRQVCPSVIN